MRSLSGETFDEARKKLELLEEADRERYARESALNELQAFVFDLQDKIYQVRKGLIIMIYNLSSGSEIINYGSGSFN